MSPNHQLYFFPVPSDSIRIHSFQWVPGWQNRLLASPELSSPVKVYSLLHCTSMCSIQRCKLFFYNVNVRSCHLLWRELTDSDSFIASFGTKAYNSKCVFIYDIQFQEFTDICDCHSNVCPMGQERRT